MRLIDADALINRMYHDAFETDTDMQKWDSGCWIRYKMFENAIDEQPTIEPKQGEWICHKGIWVDEEYYPTNYECNNCHHFVISGSDRNFCPNCGCRMKGADDE